MVTYLGEYFRLRLARAFSWRASARMVRLAPGVDTTAFRPGAGGQAIRQRLGIGPRQPVVVCVSRMVPRKGQDTLLQAWPMVQANVGGNPLLLLVGDGPYRAELGRLAQRLGVSDSVLFAGPVPGEELPAYYDAGNVFAMPCRTRRKRPGRGGPRHRLPGGVRHRPAGGRRRLGRRAGRHRARRDRLRGARRQRGRPRGPADRAAVRPGRGGRDGRQGPGLGRPRVAVEPGGQPEARSWPSTSWGPGKTPGLSARSGRGSTRRQSRSC